ncbi:MAG: hypothetical protein EB072_06490 [Betaproteobacteria bacterium]|nr:hypothetical protein [Betaproteobacteria bacterium]
MLQMDPAAPVKPVWGEPCNGCGVCCMSEPCPLGVWLTRQRQGPCGILRWEVLTSRYVCGALVEPELVAQMYLPKGMKWLATVLHRLLRLMAPRWIASGTGCDCSYEVQPVSPKIPP